MADLLAELQYPHWLMVAGAVLVRRGSNARPLAGRSARDRAMMVRCIDSFLQSDVLIEGHVYEVLGERDDCYVLSGFDKPLSKIRFEPVTLPIESPSEA